MILWSFDLITNGAMSFINIRYEAAIKFNGQKTTAPLAERWAVSVVRWREKRRGGILMITLTLNFAITMNFPMSLRKYKFTLHVIA